jgi:acetyl-CoA carboxylase carboxyltransferase component
MGREKENRITEGAGKARAPLVRLIDSIGARLSPGQRTQGETHADRYPGGRLFYLMSRLS